MQLLYSPGWLLLEGGIYFVGKSAGSNNGWIRYMWAIEIHAGSSTCSLSVLLLAIETNLRTWTCLEIARWVLAGIHGFMHCVYILATATIRWWRLFHLELLIVQLLFNSSSNWRNMVKIMYSAPSNTRLAHSHTPVYQNVSPSLQGVCTEVCCLSDAYCSSTCEL